MQTQITVLFTGLIREYEVFKKSLEDLAQLKKEGFVDTIMLATRIGEPAKHPDMHEAFKQAGVVIIEAEDPALNENSPYYQGKDFIWRQMKGLEVGLTHIAKGTFVLKTRSDTYIEPQFIKKLATEKETLLKITKNLPKGNVFKCKVWVPWFELTKPFFMADECFFGLKEDLEKLYNYNKDYFEKYDLGTDVHHVMRFIEPFLAKYPFFTSSMSRYRKDRAMKNFLKRNFPKMYEQLKHFSFIKKASERNRFAILNARLEDQDYLDLLAAYYYVLYSHFYIDLVSFPDQIVFRDFYKGVLPRSDKKNAEKNFSVEKVRFPGSGMLYFYEQGFVNALLEGKLEKTPLQEQLTEGLRRFEKL
ncbi:MAG: hypothetical protein AABX53_02850 [Nanoarchaeota archaeon]|mgnify:CR=1 FL=1